MGAVPADDLPGHLAAQQDTSTPKPPEASTTAPGLAASFARGAAPYAVGAGVGAAIGGPPGAAAGVLLTGGAQTVLGLYDMLAGPMGWPRAATPQDATDRVLTHLGIKQPSTGAERVSEAVGGGVGGAGSEAVAAGTLAETAATPALKSGLELISRAPARQAVSGGLQGAGAQTAAEMGAGPTGQLAASFLAGLFPYGGGAASRLIEINPKQAARDAVNVGYVLPPAEATEGSIGGTNVPSALAAFSGKVKTRQYASAVNQGVTNRLTAVDLGLPPDTPMTPKVYEDVIAEGGKAYAALKAVPEIVADDDYRAAATKLGADARAAAAEFPDLVDVKGIEKIRDQLLGKNKMSTNATVETIKRLRFDAKANLRARDNPDRLTLGLAQRQAAGILEDLAERNLEKTGQVDLVNDFREQRIRIAKAYDYEAATDVSTNNVDARHLGALLNKGRPLSGNMKLIADSANNFPHAFQPEQKIGGVETWSVLDAAYAAGAAGMAAARGDYALAAALAAATPFARVGARSAVLSQRFQRTMVGLSPPSPGKGLPLSVLAQPGFFATAPRTPADTNQELGIQ